MDNQNQLIGIFICLIPIFVMAIIGAIYRIRLGNKILQGIQHDNHDSLRRKNESWRIRSIAFLGLANMIVFLIFLSFLYLKPSIFFSYGLYILITTLVIGLFVGVYLWSKIKW